MRIMPVKNYQTPNQNYKKQNMSFGIFHADIEVAKAFDDLIEIYGRKGQRIRPTDEPRFWQTEDEAADMAASLTAISGAEEAILKTTKRVKQLQEISLGKIKQLKQDLEGKQPQGDEAFSIINRSLGIDMGIE